MGGMDGQVHGVEAELKTEVREARAEQVEQRGTTSVVKSKQYRQLKKDLRSPIQRKQEMIQI